MIDKALCIDKYITCVIGVISKYDKPQSLKTTIDAYQILSHNTITTIEIT
jgi:hypothetical protein